MERMPGGEPETDPGMSAGIPRQNRSAGMITLA